MRGVGALDVVKDRGAWCPCEVEKMRLRLGCVKNGKERWSDREGERGAVRIK